MNLTTVSLGLLSIFGGLYMRRYPKGRWNRFAAEYTEMFRDPGAEQKMAPGAPVVGALLIIGGVAATVAGLLGV